MISARMRCCPTRASLLTGLYPHQAGVGGMTNDRGAEYPGYRGTLQPNTVTLAEVLRDAGYTCGLKIAVGWLRGRPWYRHAVVFPCSGAIAFVGLFWAVQRAGWL